MTRILLLNVHSFRNAGDAALALVTAGQLQASFPGCELTLAMDDPASHFGDGEAIGSLSTWLKTTREDNRPRWNKANLFWLIPATLAPVMAYRLFGKPVFAITPTHLRGLLQAYLDASLVVSMPGGFLYHSGSGISLALAAYTIALAWAAGKPFYIFPQSIGPLHYGWEKALIRWLLRRARVVMVREPVSVKHLAECGLAPADVRLLPDPAFCFPAAPAQQAGQWLQAQGVDPERDRPFLGITMINWGAQNPKFDLQERYEQAVTAAARHFIERYGGRVFFIPQVWGPFASQDDRIPARRAAARLAGLSQHVVQVDEPVTPALLKAIYGQMDAFIGTRMHSNIFALSEGVPVIAIGYQHKTLGIAQMAGMGEWVMDIRQVDERTLVECLDRLWERRHELHSKLQETIPQLAEQASLAGALAAADYTSLQKNRFGNM